MRRSAGSRAIALLLTASLAFLFLGRGVAHICPLHAAAEAMGVDAADGEGAHDVAPMRAHAATHASTSHAVAHSAHHTPSSHDHGCSCPFACCTASPAVMATVPPVTLVPAAVIDGPTLTIERAPSRPRAPPRRRQPPATAPPRFG